MRVVAGGSLADTVNASPLQALVVEVRDSTRTPRRGVTVRFDAVRPTNPARPFEAAIYIGPLAGQSFGTFVTDVTDSLGRAKVLVQLGTLAGPAYVRASVPELGLIDSVPYTVLPGAPARLVIGVRDTTVPRGAAYELRASATDRYGNPVSAPVAYRSLNAVATVSPTGLVTAGNTFGRGVIAVTAGPASDTSRLGILPKLALITTRLSATAAVERVNTDGSGAIELTTSNDRSLAPHQVAGSDLVVYYQGNPAGSSAVWLVDSQRIPRVLLSSTLGFVTAAWPRLAPDGQWVYFVGTRRSNFQAALWRIRPDGTQLDSLTTFTRSSALYFTSVAPGGNTVALGEDTGIKLFDVTTRTSRSLPRSCTMPQFSPDGAHLACVDGSSIVIMNVDGSAARTLPIATSISAVGGLDWSADGLWLIFVNAGNVPTLVAVSDGLTMPISALGGHSQVQFIR